MPALAVVALSGCTVEQLDAWLAWHADDPAAAIEYANRPEVAAEVARGFERSSDAPQFGPWLESRYGVSVWDDIAACESGGRWDYPPVRNSSGTYSGGLMIGHRWWPSYGGREFAAQPYQATKAEQIIVAERIADDAGLDAGWQCYP